MTITSQAAWLFRINAVTNWLLSSGAMVAPVAVTVAYGGPPPNYPSIVRLWAGLVFMFGCMFFETSRDVIGKRHLVKYNWIEKTITATAITLGYLGGDVPARLMALIVCTNWLWIPVVLYYDLALRRVAHQPLPCPVASTS
jgi:hypothetical protein